VTTEHGRGLWKSGGRVLFERLLNGITDLRICVSRDILELRARREGTPRRKLEYLPNGVDIERFRSPVRSKQEIMAEMGWAGDDPLVVSIGRLVEEKNYPLLVESITHLMSSIPGVRCVIAGEGKRRSEVESQIERMDAGEHVRLVGTRSDVADLLHAADVFVLASMREGFPVSLIEAMACGKAIVATDVGGIPDAVVGGRNGILVRPGDAHALSEAISTLLVDRGLAGRLGQEALETAVEKFSLKHVVRRTKEIYFELYSRKTE
jgi:glycosyltransferase involved in cell wall biosynthesis